MGLLMLLQVQVLSSGEERSTLTTSGHGKREDDIQRCHGIPKAMLGLVFARLESEGEILGDRPECLSVPW
jgi:hypothetical protein